MMEPSSENRVPDYLNARLEEFLDSVASPEPAPGGGSVSAIVVAFAAGLTAMAARFSKDHLSEAAEIAAHSDEVRRRVAPLARADAEAYGEVLAAQRGPERSAALSEAADIPLLVAKAGLDVARIAHHLAEHGNPNLEGDANTAALLAEAASRSAATLAVLNLSAAGVEDERLDLARKLAASEAGT